MLTIAVKTALLGSFLMDPSLYSNSDALVPANSFQAAISREFITPAFAQDQPAEGAAEQAEGADPAETDGGTASMLRQKKEALERRELALKTLEQEVDAKLARLQEMQGKIEQMLAEAKQTRDAKLRHLIDVYSNMKARQAAEVIETLDEDIAVKILAGMRGRQAGEILTYVEARKAATLSEKLTRMQVPF